MTNHPETDRSTRSTAKKAGRSIATTLKLLFGLVLLVALIAFVVQNLEAQRFDFFGLETPQLAVGVYMLIAAAVGFLIAVLVTGGRKVSKKL